MITVSNLQLFLANRGFTQDGDIFEKAYGLQGSVRVNMADKIITYPTALQINDATTSNFSANENFVVLDCVDRLLEQGYPADCIELEKRWKLGHTGKSGKADVCVHDRAGDMYLIIECKTWGNEYRYYDAQLEKDGGQLFSYWQQETKTRWLCLYTAGIEKNTPVYEGRVINVSLPEYKTASTVSERYHVWHERLHAASLDATAIYGEGVEAYKIDEQPFTKQELREFTPESKGEFILNFEEILRHNSISDKENAFNRLVALFICKIVDELTKSDKDILDFQVRYSDTYELLMDRLQLLYKEGMSQFLEEDIYYLDLNYPHDFAAQYRGKDRHRLIQDLQNTIRRLKFFSNGDFSFKDVHNDRLFRENGAILFEMVRLMQNWKMVYPSRHQILGDLFETLLSTGFKQDEGQFFTPTPITRFIWDSIPPSMLENGDGYPKIIDFACGAGHFLNEGVALLDELHPSENNDWCAKKVYGVEKDDRLARVSKVSMLMNGVLASHIINGDGLAEHPDVKDGTYDIVVSNPPYSVTGFKQYLPSQIRNRLSLAQNIRDTGKEIEVLFIQRAEELLRPDGVCMLILPTSLLSNTDTVSVETRKFLLSRFRLHAIVNLGNKTFQDTGTPTSIFFMRKRHSPPKQHETAWDTVDQAFTGGPDVWEGQTEFKHYLEYRNISSDAIRAVLEGKEGWWLEADELIPRELHDSDQKNRVRDEIIAEQRNAFYYYLLCRDTKVVFVQAPSVVKEQEAFLGYKWSSSRSNKGLSELGENSVLDGYEFRAPVGTVAYLIRKSFQPDFTGEGLTLPKYTKVLELMDMVDLSSGDLVLNGEEPIRVNWKHSTVTLGEMCPTAPIGFTPSRRNTRFFVGTNQWASIKDIKNAIQKRRAYLGRTSETISDEAVEGKAGKALPKDTLVMSFKLTIGACAFTSADETYTNEAIIGLNPSGPLYDRLENPDEAKNLDKNYLYCLIASKALPLVPTGTKKIGKTLNKKTLYNTEIPYPDEKTRISIVSQCLNTDRSWKKSVADVRRIIVTELAGAAEYERVTKLMKEQHII
ncbi:type IIG restriction modification system restriction enzyme/N6-adenine DNA methyltransferase [Bifidobacterium pseudolongum subsp. pseudolongum]|nr:type IIG restriction modification system restriction enzyme/N6-adenine DNA methyltransferase [Bifidobacterium pseudolongum subsp. pseudolongum]